MTQTQAASLQAAVTQFHELVALQEDRAVRAFEADMLYDALEEDDRAAGSVQRAGDAFRKALEAVMLNPAREWLEVSADTTGSGLARRLATVKDRLKAAEWVHVRTSSDANLVTTALRAGDRWADLVEALPSAASAAAVETRFRETMREGERLARAVQQHPLREELLGAEGRRDPTAPLATAMLAHAAELCSQLDHAPHAERQELLDALPRSFVAKLYQAHRLGVELDDARGR